MIADWWPDEWDYPVGYHVTVPCEAEDTAYRSFHQAFASTDPDWGGVPVIVYEHDSLRDGALVDQNFGVAGLCRSTNWGMDTFALNTMRYCTRMQYLEQEDYTVFWNDNARQAPTSDWGDWACTTSAQQVPWPDYTVTDAPNTDTHESNLYSVGTLPNMPSAGDDYYPADPDLKMYAPGPWHDIIRERGWGAGCSDYPLFYCATDADCPANSYRCRGRFCRNSYIPCQSNSDCAGTGYGDCEGVCLEKSVDCIRHSECPDDKMCTGLGACVKPVLTLQNKVSQDDFAFQVNAKNQTCPKDSRPFSLLGASYWAYVTNDVLRVHGMCSYGDWYKYQMTLLNCQPVDGGDYWGVDPTKCQYLELDSQVLNVTRWWERTGSRPQIMYMHPSNCDKDYERLDDFMQCAPQKASIKASGKDLSQQIVFDEYTKMHMGDTPAKGGVTIPLAKMPFASDKTLGFLGIDSIKTDKDLVGAFQSCSNLNQCTPPPFTSNGKKVLNRKRMDWGSKTQSNYTDDDVFKCGVFGYISGDQCVLDLSVLQIYAFLCRTPGQNTGCTSLVPNIVSMCDEVSPTYPAGYAGVASNVKALNALLYAIPPPVDLESYLDTTGCMQDLYTFMNSSQLYPNPYLVMDFVLYEIPFDWFYQCMVMTQNEIDTKARYNQDCRAYKNRESFGFDSYTPKTSVGDDAMTMLRFVRGGYTRAQVLEYTTTYQTRALKLLNDTITGIINKFYKGEDWTYPRCSTVQRWKIGSDYTNPYVNLFRAIIDTHYTVDVCKGSWFDDQVAQAERLGYNVNSNNFIEELTTYDPEMFETDSYWQGEKTILEVIRDLIQERIKYTLASRVMGDYPAAPGAQFVTRREAIVIDNSVPPEFTDQLPWEIDPSYPRADTGEIVDMDTEFVPHVCVYDLYEYDPVFKGIYSLATCAVEKVKRKDSETEDTLMVCNGKQCTSVPIYYSINGVYNCMYYPEFPNKPCNSTNPGCGRELLNALYSEVISSYKPETVEPLKPVLLPWFRSRSWEFNFELSSVLDYLGNIMPNKEKTIMCTLSSQDPIDLMNCSNPHFLKLQQHVRKYYKYNGSVIVPRDAQLDWEVDRAFLDAGAIFSYASTARDRSHTFLDALFDDQSVCKGDASGDQRICWRANNASTWNSVNPWMLGYWNPFVQCDVDFTGQTQTPVETVNAYCTDVSCPPSSTYYQNMPNREVCKASFAQRVPKSGVPQIDVFGATLPYNLCFHKLVEDQPGCLHDQALLGGFDGMSIGTAPGSVTMTDGTPYADAKYKLSTDMYQPSTWEIPSDFYGGL